MSSLPVSEIFILPVITNSSIWKFSVSVIMIFLVIDKVSLCTPILIHHYLLSATILSRNSSWSHYPCYFRQLDLGRDRLMMSKLSDIDDESSSAALWWQMTASDVADDVRCGQSYKIPNSSSLTPVQNSFDATKYIFAFFKTEIEQVVVLTWFNFNPSNVIDK